MAPPAASVNSKNTAQDFMGPDRRQYRCCVCLDVLQFFSTHGFMTSLSNIHRHKSSLIALLVAIVLAGCAYAPGMYVGNSLALADSTAAAQDAPPPGRLTAITPELIRQQRAGRATDVAPAVKKLFDQPKPYQIGPGDVLNIVVWDHPELSIAPAGSLATDASSLSAVGNGHNVSPQGLIQFPFVGTKRATCSLPA
jgi:polysaccharide export outer membrane protein